MVNAQSYIEKKYPPFIRQNLRQIHIFNLNLEGILDLKEFEKLEILDCSYNRLTELKLNSAVLKKLYCNDNQLTRINSLFPLELEEIEARNNCLSYPKNRETVQLINPRNLKSQGGGKRPNRFLKLQNTNKENQPRPETIGYSDLLNEYFSAEQNIISSRSQDQHYLERLWRLQGKNDQEIKNTHRRFQVLVPPKN